MDTTENEKYRLDQKPEKLMEAIKNIEVKDEKIVNVRKSNITAKTLKALTDQAKRIKEEKLLDEKEIGQLEELLKKVRSNWINKNL